MWAILSILVENRPGILWKVTNLFRGKNFNIDSISVGTTPDPDISRMIITTNTDEKQIQQIVKQLTKMIDTIEVKHLDEHKTVYRELIIFRIKIKSAQDTMEINRIASAYGGKIHDAKKESIMVELAATPDHVKSFEELLKPFGIIETSRTGIAALQRAGT